MELGEINSGEGSKNQQVEIQVEGNNLLISVINKIDVKIIFGFEVYRNDSSDQILSGILLL